MEVCGLFQTPVMLLPGKNTNTYWIQS